MKSIARVWEERRSLTSAINGRVLEKLLSSPEVAACWDRLQRDGLGIAELTSRFENGKVSIAYFLNSWSLVLIRDYQPHDHIALTPTPNILAPFNEDGEISIVEYYCEPDNLRSATLNDASVSWSEDVITLRHGEYWTTPRLGVHPHIVDASDGVVLARISGPTLLPYAHTISPDGNYLFTSFANESYSSRALFGDLFKYCVSNGMGSTLPPSEREALVGLAYGIASSSDGMAEEVWPMVQGLAGLDQRKAVDALRAIAMNHHELGEAACNTLEKNGIPIDA